MPLAVVPALVAAGLLMVAGALKVLDPTMTVGAFRALGLPASPTGIRLLAGVELLVGAFALAWGGVVAWALVGASYVVLIKLSIAAVRSGTPIGSCGCFGRADTPPHWSHVVVLGVLWASLVLWVIHLDRAPLEELADRPGAGALAVAVAAALLAGTYAVFTRAPAPAAPAEAGRR